MHVQPPSPSHLLSGKPAAKSSSITSPTMASIGSRVSKIRSVSSKPQTAATGARSKQYSLQDHSDTVLDMWQKQTQAHFKRDDVFMTDELPIKPILNYLVKEGVALDRDKAKQAVEQEIGPLARDGMISYDEFSKIFCRGMFKQAIVHSAESFMESMDAKGSKTKDMGLK